MLTKCFFWLQKPVVNQLWSISNWDSSVSIPRSRARDIDDFHNHTAQTDLQNCHFVPFISRHRLKKTSQKKEVESFFSTVLPIIRISWLHLWTHFSPACNSAKKRIIIATSKFRTKLFFVFFHPNFSFSYLFWSKVTQPFPSHYGYTGISGSRSEIADDFQHRIIRSDLRAEIVWWKKWPLFSKVQDFNAEHNWPTFLWKNQRAWAQILQTQKDNDVTWFMMLITLYQWVPPNFGMVIDQWSFPLPLRWTWQNTGEQGSFASSSRSFKTCKKRTDSIYLPSHLKQLVQ